MSAAHDKEPFDLDRVLDLVRGAVRPLPKAALFQLVEEGFGAPFEQLVACVISTRTRDEVTLPAALRLLGEARTPAALAALTPARIDALISPCTFHEPKSRQLHELALRVVAEHGGALPCEEEVLLGFRGVGPKCAHLVLGIACGVPAIGVDVHVHRITNRWGYVETASPEQTMRALEGRLPRRYWVELGRLLVPFGKHVCVGALPRCSTCPVLTQCRQVGVMAHR